MTRQLAFDLPVYALAAATEHLPGELLVLALEEPGTLLLGLLVYWTRRA